MAIQHVSDAEERTQENVGIGIIDAVDYRFNIFSCLVSLTSIDPRIQCIVNYYCGNINCIGVKASTNNYFDYNLLTLNELKSPARLTTEKDICICLFSGALMEKEHLLGGPVSPAMG